MILAPVQQVGAYLQESVTGRVYLHVAEYDYSAEDPLPSFLFPPEVTPLAGKARYYVSSCMIIEYGRDESHWPALARRFLQES